MAEPELGKLTREHPHEVWANEARDFTPWLEKNIDLLNEALGLELEIERREAPVGAFAVDLFGKQVGTDRVVIIENQLERTDHGHLGQLLAYAAGLDARIVVWVSPELRDEHREAIHWLNERTGDAVLFFGVEIEVLRIGGSLPAPRFNVVAQPSSFQREIVRGTTAGPSERGLAYQRFFTDLVRRLHAERQGFTRANPDLVRYDPWTAFGSGRSGFSVEAAFASPSGPGARFRVGLTINTGDRIRNKASFDRLHDEREVIEGALRQSLEWERLDAQVTSRVAAYRDGGIDSLDDQLDGLRQWAVDLLPKFREVFAPHIAALNLDALDATEEARD